MPHQTRLTGLDFIRGTAALHVLYNHVRGKFELLLPSLREIGALHVRYSVSIFFLVSGFVIMMIAERKIRHHSIGTFIAFLKERFLRLYPSYLAALLVMVAMVVTAHLMHLPLPAGSYQWSALPAELLMILAWDHTAVWNSSAWSVNVLTWVLIIVFPPMFLLLRKLRNQIAILTLMIALLLTYAVFRNDDSVALPYYVSRVLFPFAIGMTGYTLWRRLQQPPLWLLNAIIFAGVTTYYSRPMIWGTPVPTYWLTVLILCSITLVIGAAAWPSSILSELGALQPFKMLGQISFAIYLSHLPVQRLLTAIFPVEPFIESALPVKFAVIAAYLLAFLVGALALHYLIERPFEDRRKKRKQKSKGAVAQELAPTA